MAELGDYIQSLNAAKGIDQADTRESSIIFLAERWAEFADVKAATEACQKEIKDVANRRRLNAVLAIARAKPDQWQEATTSIDVIGKP